MRQWWEEVADPETRKALCRALHLKLNPADKPYTSETAAAVINRFLLTSSRLCILQFQELFALTEKYRSKKPSEERINVPGTWDETNWTYRLPFTLETLNTDELFSNKVAAMVQKRRDMFTKPKIYS
jgi:4-alpha-glucanotransferase